MTLTQNILGFLLFMIKLLNVANREVFVETPKTEKCCELVNSCDGTLSRPFNSLFFTLYTVFSGNEDVEITLMDPSYEISLLEINQFMELAGVNSTILDSLHFKRVTLSGKNLEKATITMKEYFFSIVLRRTDLTFSNIEVNFLFSFKQSFAGCFFIKIVNIDNVSTNLTIQNSSIFIKAKEVNIPGEACILIPESSAEIRFIGFILNFGSFNVFDKFLLVASPTEQMDAFTPMRNRISFQRSKFISDEPEHTLSSIITRSNIEFNSVEFEVKYPAYKFDFSDSLVVITYCRFTFDVISNNIYYYGSFINMSYSSVQINDSIINGKYQNFINAQIYFFSFWSWNRIIIQGLTLKSVKINTVIFLGWNNTLNVSSIEAANISNRVFYMERENLLLCTLSSFKECSHQTPDNSGAVFYLNDSNSLRVYQSEFTTNSATTGGAIFANFNNSNIELGKLIVTGNQAQIGAFIYLNKNNSNIKITDSNFSNNYVFKNGGVAYFGTGNRNLEILASKFVSNTAQNGGSIFIASINVETSIKSCIFLNNSALTEGGSIYVEFGNEGIFISYVIASVNTAGSGGFLSVYKNNKQIVIFSSNFTFNSVYRYGAALWVNESNSGIIINYTYFQNNSADNGGAVAFYKLNTNISTLNSLFKLNNGEKSGGAMYFANGNRIIVIRKSVFLTNLASDAGGAYFHNENNYTIVEHSIFDNHSATLWGGVLFFRYNSFNITISFCRFFLNEGLVGKSLKHFINNNSLKWKGRSGVIAIFEANKLVTIQYCSFVGNGNRTITPIYGGTMYIYQNNTNVNFRFCFFSANLAIYGGAIGVYWYNHGLTFYYCHFHQNSALSNGGVMRLRDFNTKLNFTNSAFTENSASQYGGAIYIQDLNINISIQNCTFFLKVASEGSCFFIRKENIVLKVEGTMFFNNNAKDGGAIFFSGKNTVKALRFCFFFNNTADSGGVIYFEKSNFVNGSDLFMENSTARLLGGAVFSKESNMIKFINWVCPSTKSLAYGGVLYSNSSSVFYLLNCFFNYSYSRTGAFFYLSDGTTLDLIKTNIGEFKTNFNMSELFKLDGSNTCLRIMNSELAKIENLLINDLSQSAKVVLINNTLGFLALYNKRAIFIFSADSSEYTIESNLLFLNKKTRDDFDYFIELIGESSILLFKDNEFDYNLFPVILKINQLANHAVGFIKLKFKAFQGLLIYGDSPIKFNSPKFKNIFKLFDCRIELFGTLSHFIELRSSFYFTINSTVIWLRDDQYKSFLFNPFQKGSSGLENSKVTLNIDYSEFITFKSTAAQQIKNPDNTFEFIHTEGLVIEVSITHTQIHLGEKFYSGILYLAGDVLLFLNQTLVFHNLLNSTKSSLLFIKFSKPPRIAIISSKFKYNRVVVGGILGLEGNFKDNSNPKAYLSIKHTVIERNFAVNKGGILYLNVSWNNQRNESRFVESLRDQKNFINNSIKGNMATLGSFIYWEGYDVPNLPSLNKITMGENKVYSSFAGNSKYLSYSSSINQIRITDSEHSQYNSKKKEENSSHILYTLDQEVAKNKILKDKFYFCLSLYDKYDQAIYAPSENYLNAAYSSQSMLPNETFEKLSLTVKFRFFNGMFCAFKFDFFVDYFEKIGRTHSIQLNPQNYMNLFPYLNITLLQNYTVGFYVKNCEKGEVFDGESCQPCDRNSYSLKPELISLIDCERCDDYDDYNCYGASLRSPKVNFWRINTDSSIFLRCPSTSCLGDPDFQKNFTHRDCLNCYLPTTRRSELFYSFSPNSSGMGYCKHPYRGYLCSECKNGFGFTGAYRCGDCASALTYVKHFLVLALKILIFYYSNWKALQSKMSTKQKPEDLVLNFKYAFLLKILFKHFTIIAVLKSLPFNFNELFDDIFSNFVTITPTESFEVFSFECFLKKIGVITRPVKAVAVFTILFFIFSLILLLFFVKFRLSKLKTNRKPIFKDIVPFLRRNFVGVMLIFFLDNIVCLLEPYIKLLFVVNLGDDNISSTRLLNDLSIEAWDHSHLLYVFLFAVPCILIFGIFLPLYLMFQILRAKRKKEMKNFYFARNFSYFVFPYNNNIIYFEVLIIFNKLILIFFKEYLRLSVVSSGQKIVLLLFFFYLLFYYNFQKATSPYKESTFGVLQKIELYSLILSVSNALSAILWSLIENKDERIFNMLLLVYVTITNSIFFIIWFQKYFGFLKSQLKAARDSMKSTLKTFFGKRRRISLRRANSRGSVYGMDDTDYQKLYLENIKTVKQLEQENKALKRQNSILTQRIQLYEEIDDVIIDDEENIEQPPAEKGISFAIKRERHSNKLEESPRYRFSKHNISDKKPDFEEKGCRLNLINRKVVGSDLETHSLNLHFKEIKESSKSPAKLKGVICHHKDWKVSSFKELPEDQLHICIKRKSLWDTAPHEQLLELEFIFDLKLNDKTYSYSEDIVVERFELTVNLEEFLSFQDIYWGDHNLDNLENPLLTLCIEEAVASKLLSSHENPDILKGKWVIRCVLLGDLEIKLDIILNRDGKELNIYGNIEPFRLEILRKICSRLL